jgi:release factor glutamine methyltransferase
MKTSARELFKELVGALTVEESRDEKEAIVRWVLEHFLQLSPAAILSGRSITYDEAELGQVLTRLNNHEPVQYILGEAPFYGRTFKVNASVLIPRPETELLVKNVVDHFNANGEESISLVDIGTGSGCIATTLALEIPRAVVFATDISEEGLLLAQENATRMRAKLRFFKHDILRDAIGFGPLDAVVSNPPYVPDGEKQALKKNVIDFEPHLALFSWSNDALVFYRAIAQASAKCLKPGGLLMTEINENYGPQTAALYESLDFREVKILRDLSGKDRIVSAIKI